MVVCKFFAQGSCRYGQSCRFEHVYSSKYSYHAPQHITVQVAATNPSITDEQLIKQVQTEVQSALRGGQWLLSSYAPFKDKPALPGLQDLSFEEARLFIYEAMAANNVDQAVAYMNNLFLEAKQKHETLLLPTPIILNTLRRLYNGEIPASPFVQTNPTSFVQTNSNPTSLFRSAVQGTQNSTSIFGQSTDNSTAKSLFAQAANQNVFGNSQNQPSQNVFASQNPQTNSFFGAPTQNNPSVFSSASQNQNVFAQNGFASTNDQAKSIFAQAANQNTQNHNAFTDTKPASIFAIANQQVSDPFGQKSSPFGQNFGSANSVQVSNDSQTYSNLEDLLPEDFDAFQCDRFQLGFVPEVPPHKSLCV